MKITIGIQGGIGSFNEEACRYFCSTNNIKDYELKYLYTTEKVLEALHRGKIDYGQFAVEDPLGGIVNESIEALSKYTCKIVDKFKYPLRHVLILHKKSKKKDIKTIMTHPQIFKQCEKTIKQKYEDIDIKFGKGNLIDQAKVAEKISNGDIAKDTAIIGSRILVEIYPNLKIEDENLQDLHEIYTTFIFCKRRYII